MDILSIFIRHTTAEPIKLALLLTKIFIQLFSTSNIINEYHYILDQEYISNRIIHAGLYPIFQNHLQTSV